MCLDPPNSATAVAQHTPVKVKSPSESSREIAGKATSWANKATKEETEDNNAHSSKGDTSDTVEKCRLDSSREGKKYFGRENQKPNKIKSKVVKNGM